MLTKSIRDLGLIVGNGPTLGDDANTLSVVLANVDVGTFDIEIA